jgi:hypothetical protein
MRTLSAIALVLSIAAPFPAIAYTQEDVVACTPDAMRLCRQFLPNKGRAILCLVQNERQLGPACKMAFTRVRADIASRERPANVQTAKF